MPGTADRFSVNLMRYSLATVGPVGSAGAQFALSLVLLRVLDTSAFGSFSFLLVASQFSWGIWSALFCAPLPILLTTGDDSSRRLMLRSLFTTNLFAAVIAFALFLLLGLALGLTVTAAGLFAAYAAVALLRWFARALAYATGTPLRTTASDITYSVTLLGGAALASFGHTATLDLAYAVLLLGASLGLLPFGRAYLAGQFIHVSPRNVAGYGLVWRQHSGWSLLGVLTTEATANSYAYIVTLAYGPQGFAPLAASALITRPIHVAMNALTEFERARMARQIGDRRIELAMASVRFFRYVLVSAWIVTAIGIAALLYSAPRRIFPPQYDSSVLASGAALWMAVAGIRLLRAPYSTLLQAAGAFRPLAFASVLSSGISIPTVIALLAAGGPLWSIGGILAGEIVLLYWTWRQARRWRDASLRELMRPILTGSVAATTGPLT